MVDADDNGTWQVDEFLDAVRAIAKFTKNKLIKGWKKHVKDAFKAIDTNGDGNATTKEVMDALKKYGFPDINDLFEQDEKKLFMGKQSLGLNMFLALDKKIPSPEEVWKQFDADGSGTWDLAEAKKAFKVGMKYFGHELPKDWEKHFEAEFKKADKDGSGDVCPYEMGAYLFEAIDANDDGVWDLQEALNAIEAVAKFTKNTLKRDWKQTVTDAFNATDKNSDGQVTGKEVMAALKKYGTPDINDLFE